MSVSFPGTADHMKLKNKNWNWDYENVYASRIFEYNALHDMQMITPHALPVDGRVSLIDICDIKDREILVRGCRATGIWRVQDFFAEDGTTWQYCNKRRARCLLKTVRIRREGVDKSGLPIYKDTNRNFHHDKWLAAVHRTILTATNPATLINMWAMHWPNYQEQP